MIDAASIFAKEFLDVLRRADIPAMPGYCRFPLLMTTPKGSMVFQEASDSTDVVSKISKFYDKKGMPSFDTELLELSQLTPGSFLIRTHMRTRSSDGHLLAEGAYAFVARKIGDGFKVVTVIADGPVARLVADQYPLQDGLVN
jgi:hypothetical protein